MLRWQHPTLGRIAPNRFIPIAEETGLIVAIGDWVLCRAVEQAAAWQRAGLPPLRMAVNLSARQLLQPDLGRRIESLLSATGLDARLFGVEVTESMLIANFDLAVQHLRALRALGVEVSLDDFGTGYSSLSYLRRLPVDVVKIDRSLVPDVTAPAEDVSITRAIITMAHQLQMKVLAEGVESEGQAALLAANHCDQMQGYWFSAALPADAIESMLRSGRQIDPALLEAQRQVDGREAAQELLNVVPVPLFIIDEAGLLVFANAPAKSLCGLETHRASGPAAEQLPQVLRQALDGDPMLVTLAGRRWWAMSRLLSGNVRGRLLVLLPQAGLST